MADTPVIPVSAPDLASTATTTNAPQPAGPTFADAFSSLEKLAEDMPVQEAAKSPTSDVKPADTKSEENTNSDKASSQKPNAPTDSTKPLKPEDSSKPPKASDLRKHYDALKAEHAALQKKAADLEAKANKAPDETKLKEYEDRIASMEKARAKIEEELRFAKYESTEEYNAKYEQPFKDAYRTAVEKVSNLKITDADGNVRQASQADFDKLLRIAEDDEAAEYAAQTFGNKASLALYHREKVQELNLSRFKAIEDYKRQGFEREKTLASQREAQAKQEASMWEAENKAAAEKFPQWFKPADGDDAGNELLRKGFEMVDKAFSDKSDMTPQQRIRLESAVRNQAAAFPRMVHQNKALRAELATLKEQLAKFQKSEPGPGDGKRVETKPAELTWEQRLEQMAG